MPVYGASPNVDYNKSDVDDGTTREISGGDQHSYVYLDCEFTGLNRVSDLISIGLVDSIGRTFYAEFTDYRKELIRDTEWFEENVFSHMTSPEMKCEGDHWTITGTRKDIRTQLLGWLNLHTDSGRIVQFVTDVGHFDFIHIMDLISNGDDLLTIPADHISPCCIDLNQDIALSLYREYPEGVDKREFDTNYVPARVAFDLSRNEYYEKLTGKELPKHNALSDALVIREIHRSLWGFNK